MVLVSHIYKFIYLKNGKVAGSSVESFFGQFCVDPAKQAQYSFEDKQDESVTTFGILGHRLGGRGKNWFDHKFAKDIRQDLGEQMFNAYYKFCVVRNPYDKEVSSYFFTKNTASPHAVERTWTFKEFCRNKRDHKNDNLQRIFLDGKPVCQYYIRYENLQEDIKTVLKQLGITNYSLANFPQHKSQYRVNKKKHYSTYYDEECKEIVSKKYKVEIDMFGYTFETPL